MQIEGNKYFDEATIRERLTIQTKSWVLTSGRFSQRMMTDDAASIKALYQSNGFHGCEGRRHHWTTTTSRKPGELAVVFRITEGPQTLVKNLTIEGNNSFTDRTSWRRC